jgi:ADP-ribose pyrophosphatase
MYQKPEILRKEDLSAQDAKWVTLQKLTWKDQDGKEVRIANPILVAKG